MFAQKIIAGTLLLSLWCLAQSVRAEDDPVAQFEKRLRISKVSDGLICGAAPSRSDLAFLAQTRGIDRVICLLDPSPQVDEEKAAAEALGLTFVHRPLAIGLDGPLDKARIDRAAARSIIEELQSSTGGTAYVHCQSGRDRAGYMRFAHRMLVDKWAFADALKEALEGGFQSAKLPGFYTDMKLLASGLDALPKLKAMPISDQDLNSKQADGKIGAQTLNVKIMGEGPVVYAIHGGPGETHKLFRPYLDALSKTNTLFYFDQVGCGGSSKPQFAEAYTLARQVKELEALRDVAKHEKISLLAQSSGCALAIRYALAFPERVDKLVLVSGWANAQEFRAYLPLLGATMRPADREKYEILIGELRKSMRRPNDQELAALVANQVPGVFFGYVDDAFRAEWMRHVEISALVNAAMEEEVFRDLDLLPELSKLDKTPTLVVAGKYDLVTPPSVVESVAKGIPGAKFEVFEQSGHFPFVEENQRFIERVGAFLSSGE